MFITCFALFWLLLTACAFLPGDRIRRAAGGLFCCLAALASTLAGGHLEPWQRLLCTSLGLLYLIKTVILLRYSQAELSQFSATGRLVYMTIWPGMAPEPMRRREACSEDGKGFAAGFVFALAGCGLTVLTAVMEPRLGLELTGWLGIASLLTTIHFGYAGMLTSVMRLCGWNVGPLFDHPLRSSSLQDFWSRRWNLAFVEMDKVLFVQPLRRLFGASGAVFLVFLISGLLHDLAISYPAGGGWGPPTLYFILNGLAMLAEHRYLKANSHPLLRLVWTWAWLLLPLPLLFTEQFRSVLVVPLFQFLHQMLAAHDASWYLSLALWCAALGHFLTLGAGLQVPFRLNWKDELARLSSFNRKIFLNYAAYVGLMIVSFGILSLVLHDEMMRGDKAAVCLAVLIAIFWGVRVLVDYFYFGHKDWPAGPLFVIGHTCLTTLFVFLTSTYAGIAVWHLVVR